jgi:hypothetical protein
VRRRRVTRIVGEGSGRQTRWEVVAHAYTVRSPPGIAPAVGVSPGGRDCAETGPGRGPGKPGSR